MNFRIERIHLSIDGENDPDIDYKNGNSDVIVEFQNGETYVATFFTYENLESMRLQNKISGGFMKGKYFWKENMVFIDNCSQKNVQLVIQNMIEEGDFQSVFRKI